MDGDDAQGRLSGDQIGDHRAARLHPRQIEPAEIGDGERRAHEDRIAVPAEAGLVGGHGDRHEAGLRLDLGDRQRRRARAKPPVGFLKHHDIGIQIGDHAEDARRIAAPVCADGLADIVAGNAQGGGMGNGHSTGAPRRKTPSVMRRRWPARGTPVRQWRSCARYQSTIRASESGS